VPSPARGLTQPERVAQSNHRLLEAAAELIVEKGWEATTAAEIGRRAGYSRAMVHARYGSKDAILEAFLHEYVKRLDPDPHPDADGLSQVLAHFDRIHDLYTEDRTVLRAMFVSTFEAAKTSSPVRGVTRAQLESGAANVEAALRTGIHDGSVRHGIDVGAAVNDITATAFGLAFQWVVVPGHDLAAELQDARARVIERYGS
jgi:AcrR family transcriptional regulator